MNRASAAYSVHRLTTIVLEIIECTAWTEEWTCLKDFQMQILKACTSERNTKFGIDSRQWRLVTVTASQDDLVVAVIGHRVAERVDHGIENIMADLVIHLS